MARNYFNTMTYLEEYHNEFFRTADNAKTYLVLKLQLALIFPNTQQKFILLIDIPVTQKHPSEGTIITYIAMLKIKRHETYYFTL